MLKILTIAALSVASVTAVRQDFLDCAKHAPLIAAVAAAEAAYDAARPDGGSTIKADTQAAWSAAQAAIGASLKAAFDAGEDGMGCNANSLQLGCDIKGLGCPTFDTYVDPVHKTGDASIKWGS